MDQYLIYFIFAMIFLLVIVSSFVFRKLRIWKYILMILTIGFYFAIPYLINYVSLISEELLYTIYYFFLVGILALFGITFKNKMRITKNLTDYDFFEIEKELDEIKDSSELLRMRFINTISLLSKGLIFYDEDLSGLFVTDQFLQMTGTTENSMSLETYSSLIYPDDQSSYLQTIKKVNKKNPSYDIKYRIKRNQSYIWVEEKARIFEFNHKIQVISIIQGIDIKLFPETAIHELDSLPQEPQLIQYLSQTIKEPESFYFIMIHLTNIPDINQRFGRDVGNLMIAEYIKKMRYHFAKDINSIFRITGIQFGLIIKEQRKYDVLLRALQSGGDLINLTMNIGGIQQMVYPNLGILKIEPWSNYKVTDIISLSNKALLESISSIKKNYSIFGE